MILKSNMKKKITCLARNILKKNLIAEPTRYHLLRGHRIFGLSLTMVLSQTGLAYGASLIWTATNWQWYPGPIAVMNKSTIPLKV